MFLHTVPTLERAEQQANAGGDLREVLPTLRELALDDFGELLLQMPIPSLRGLSRLLPAMASPDVQRQWTGGDGYGLLRQTLNFVRGVACRYLQERGTTLQGARILDFGCGYGRILRLMYYFTDPSLLYGCDPWDQSLAACRSDGIRSHLALSEYLPSRIPFTDCTFDLIYCFSVFTHLSRRAAEAALQAIREAIADDGLLVLTIRPVEYWRADPQRSPEVSLRMEDQHRDEGFAFLPHNLPPVDGDITYGDTSMTIEYVERHFPRWRVSGYDRTLDDPFQVVLYLRPV